jgi:hypothetical protein
VPDDRPGTAGPRRPDRRGTRRVRRASPTAKEPLIPSSGRGRNGGLRAVGTLARAKPTRSLL